jgi:GntR family transcriptional repressor for pyruvate dehydrogenase complex
MTLKSDSKGPLKSRRIADELRAMIADGRLGPDSRLPSERLMAERMGVSRVSVRAALQQLKAEGFLDAKRGSGTKVVSSVQTLETPLLALVRGQPENFSDLLELRALLEGWAAARAARLAGPADLEEIGKIVRAMERDRQFRHAAENDLAFHMAVARASGSIAYQHIVAVIRQTLAKIVTHLHDELQEQNGLEARILEQHRAIFEAIRDKNPELATAHMTAHLLTTLFLPPIKPEA